MRHIDICSSSGRLDGAKEKWGFIHSPNYPSYYGNSRSCNIDLAVPSDKRLVLFMVRVSMEDSSVFHGSANDYVRITADGLDNVYYGLHPIPKSVYDGTTKRVLRVHFRSDWITTQRLLSPKGFLVYFECMI